MQSSIGVFDSGHGGLTVLKSLSEVLPKENFIYFGDSKNAPYGNRSKREITDLSFKIVEFLIEKGAKAIVVACNTATSAAIKELRDTYSIPIIGMEPAIKPASVNKKILVLATEYTIKNKKYNELLLKMPSSARYDSVSAGELVKFAEKGEFRKDLVFNYFKELNLDRQKYDAVVLGCTHFLFFKSLIEEYFINAKIYDGNYATALHLKKVLEDEGLLSEYQNREIVIINSLKDEQERAKCLYQMYK